MTQSSRIGVALTLTVSILSALFVLHERRLSANVANGTYNNDCCGKIVLSGGTMILGDKGEQSVGYVIESDQKGPFILPRFYVGTWEDRGFQMDGSRPALRLRLDKLPAPSAIQLYDGRKSYVFTRQGALLRQSQ